MPDSNITSWFDRDTIRHLRIPFSFHLLPVFLFALSQSQVVSWSYVLFAFVILHFFIYPASNGYNSYQDRDETSIGGLKEPPKVNEGLFYVTLLLDACGVLLSMIVSNWFALFVFIYVVISRAYSYRRLRLKKFALTGFFTVFIFQGAFTYLMCKVAFVTWQPGMYLIPDNMTSMLISSLFIGSVYPLTQIYQHEADKKDNVITISYMLGYRGTFIFSAFMFLAATVLLMLHFEQKHERIAFAFFIIAMTPVVIRLLIWFAKVRKNTEAANYENTMAMNLLASGCMNTYFIILILNNIYRWF